MRFYLAKIRTTISKFKLVIFNFIQLLYYPTFMFFYKSPEYTVKTKINEIEIKYFVSSKRSMVRARSEFESEPELIELIDDHNARNPVLLDIGANVGTFSMYAAKKGFKVVSIEPSYVNSYILSRNIQLNDLSSKVTALKLALSNYIGFHELSHHRDVEAGNSGATIESYYAEELSTVVYKETVLVDTADGIVSRLCMRPTILKIDTDGNEMSILKGSVQLLNSRSVVSILIEVSSPSEMTEVINFLSEFNYSLQSDSSKSALTFMKNLIFKLI